MIKKSINSIFFKNTFNLTLSSFINNGFLFVTNILLARNFSPDIFGTILLIVSVNVFFTLMADMGIPLAITYFISKHSNTKIETNNLIYTGLILTLSFSLLFAGILFFTSEKLSNAFFSQDVTLLLKISTIWIISTLFFKLFISIFNGFQQMKFSLIISIIYSSFRFITLSLIISFNNDLFHLISWWTISYISCLLPITAIFLYFLKKESIKITHKHKLQIKVFRYGLIFFLPYLGTYLTPHIINGVAGKILSPSDIAIFTIAFQLASLNLLISTPFASVFMPFVSNSKSQNHFQNLINISLKSFIFFLILNFFIVFILLFFGDNLISYIYGKNYLDSYSLLKVLAIAFFFESFKMITDPLLNGLNFAKTVTIIEIFKFIIIIILSILFISSKGMLGVAYAICIAYILSTIIKMYKLYNLKKLLT